MAWHTRQAYRAQPVDCSAPVPIGTLPAGYSVTLPNLTRDQAFTPVPGSLGPLLGVMTLGGTAALGTPARNPQIGSFIRDSYLTAGTLGELGQIHYVPSPTPDGRIGRFVIGRSPVGWRRDAHKNITAPEGGLGETEPP